MQVIIDVLGVGIDLFFEMAPYMLIGMFFAGLLYIFVTKSMVARHVGTDSFLSVFKAALLGVPLPLCSCGVIPSAVYLKKNGASKGSVISFLISTPQTGIDSMIATYGMMGLVFAIFRPVSAFVMGIIGGAAVRFIPSPDTTGGQNAISDDDEDNSTLGLGQRIKKMLKYSFVDFIDDISVQFVVGLIISGLITFFVPDKFFSDYGISDGIAGMLVAMAIGIPMYVCATASIPIALTLMAKGISPGVAFVFLVTGPATNAASLAILGKVLGKKVTTYYVAIIAVLSVVFGYLLDFIFAATGAPLPTSDVISCHAEGASMGSASTLEYAAGSFFAILIILSFYRKFLKPLINKGKNDNMKDTTIFDIEGMTCNHCVMNVEKSIRKVEGIGSVRVDLAAKKAFVDGEFSADEVKKSIESAGYEVVSVKKD